MLSLFFFSYLKEQGDDVSRVCYDVKYALRLCLGDESDKMKSPLRQACVIIYTVLKLYEEAVSMALKVKMSYKHVEFSLHYTRGITQKRVTSGGAHLRGSAPGATKLRRSAAAMASPADTKSNFPLKACVS